MKQILTLILITLGIATQAQEKIYLGSNIDGDKYYLYPSTIRKSTYGITAWYNVIHGKPQYDKYKNKYYTYNKDQLLIDCDGMRASFLSMERYSKNGYIIGGINISEYEAYLDLKPGTPGSMSWTIIEKTCKRYRGY